MGNTIPAAARRCKRRAGRARIRLGMGPTHRTNGPPACRLCPRTS